LASRSPYVIFPSAAEVADQQPNDRDQVELSGEHLDHR